MERLLEIPTSKRGTARAIGNFTEQGRAVIKLGFDFDSNPICKFGHLPPRALEASGDLLNLISILK
jgi:hypothetical protein